MKFTTSLFSSVAFALLAVGTSQAAPAAELEARQLGGGPDVTFYGPGWGPQWRDTKILEPLDFDAIPRGGCSYDVVFRRDARDTKYLLSYYSVFNSGEIESQELKKATNLQWRGTTDSTGRREYYAFISDACSTFFTARPPPRALKVYLQPRTYPAEPGFYKVFAP